MKSSRGFSLVEIMLVVSLVGVLAVLATYGVHKYVNHTKTVEARNTVPRIAADAVASWTRDSASGTVLAHGASSSTAHSLCASSTRVPATVPMATKYQSKATEWTSDPGWACLKFTMDQPQYYSYTYNAMARTGPHVWFQAMAQGDLNANGVWSVFILEGYEMNGILQLAPNIQEQSPDE